MLTPSFELSQDKDYLTIFIKSPFAKISETELFIEENDFKFFSKPYFLRLTLPGNIVEDGREKADYNVDKGAFTIVVPKETPGEHFEGLDMITKLLAPKGSTSASTPLIQVVDEQKAEERNDVGDDEAGDEDGEEEEEYDWSIPQTPYTEELVPVGAPTYGFANQKSGVFKRLQEELCGIVDCPEPDSLPVEERREGRSLDEKVKFDEDYYLSDLCEDEMIQPLIAFTPPWVTELDHVHGGLDIEQAVELTEEEQDLMRKLPRKEYLLDPVEETHVWVGLVDILFAYAYNFRSTMGESTVESGWTVSKISATLSWLEVFNNLQEVLISCYRRSLSYPLYRHWGLSTAVLQDVAAIFKLGRRRLLKCLLEVHSELKDQDSRYILNDLYITDYCVWIQGASSKRIQSLAECLSKAHVTKEEVDLGIVEAEALLTFVDDVDCVTAQMAEVTVNGGKTEDQSDTETDSSDECSDTDSIDSDDIISDDDVTGKDVNTTAKTVHERTEGSMVSDTKYSSDEPHCADDKKNVESVQSESVQSTNSIENVQHADLSTKPLITVID